MRIPAVRPGRAAAAAAALAALAGATIAVEAAQKPAPLVLVSATPGGAAGDAQSYGAQISGSGRFVVFVSGASNLVTDDYGDLPGIFVRDLATRRTVRANVPLVDRDPAASADAPVISDNGRFAAFESSGANLVTDDSNDATDVFLRDLKAGTTTRITVTLEDAGLGRGGLAPAISGNGRFVAFVSQDPEVTPDDVSGRQHVYLRDTRTRRSELVSIGTDAQPGNDESAYASVSSNGRFVAFGSRASNLDPEDANAVADIFVRDRTRRTTTRISRLPGGPEPDGESYEPSISANGRLVAFTSRSTTHGANSTGTHAQVVLYDAGRRTIVRISGPSATVEGDGASYTPRITPNGRYVAFTSTATNLVPGDGNGAPDVFVYDVRKRTLRRVSTTAAGAEIAEGGSDTAIAANGRTVVFHSNAPLTGSDVNGTGDVFVRSTK